MVGHREMSEEFPILMRRVLDKLVPASSMDADRLREFPSGRAVRVRVTLPRNVGRLRLYFALLRVVHQNMDNPPPEAKLHEAIKVRLGYSQTIRFKDGSESIVPDSVAFDKMSETDFAEFLERFKDFLTTVIIPGLDKPALEAAANEILGN